MAQMVVVRPAPSLAGKDALDHADDTKLAQQDNDDATAEKGNPQSDRWAALRGYISQTMEQKIEFKKPA